MLSVLAEVDWNWLLQQPDTFPMLLGFGTTAIVILGAIITIQWRRVQQAKCEALLKAQMIWASRQTRSPRSSTPVRVADVLAR